MNESEHAKLRKNIRQYSKKYDALDDQAKEAARNAVKNERDAKNRTFQAVLKRVEDYKFDRYDENGWSDAIEAHLATQGWEQHDDILEEEVDVTEEKIV